MLCVLTGIYSAVLLDRCNCKLQHLFGDRDDVAGDISSARPPQDLPHPLHRLHYTARSFHGQEHCGNPNRHLRDGSLLVLLCAREPKEISKWCVARFTGSIICFALINQCNSRVRFFLQVKVMTRMSSLQMAQKEAAPLLAIQNNDDGTAKWKWSSCSWSIRILLRSTAKFLYQDVKMDRSLHSFYCALFLQNFTSYSFIHSFTRMLGFADVRVGECLQFFSFDSNYLALSMMLPQGLRLGTNGLAKQRT